MRKTRIPLATALAMAALSMPSIASANALGEVLSLSAIGTPFRAEIRLFGDSSAGLADCLRLGPAGASGDGLPWLTQASVHVTDKPSPRVIVSGVRAMHEPALKLAIEDLCADRLRREYTLLLPYPEAGTTVSASAQSSQGPRSPSAATRSAGRTWTTAPGESLESLARSLYPDNGNARARFMGATAAANPQLFATEDDRTRELAAGTSLTVPDLRRLAATSAASASGADPVRTPERPSPRRRTSDSRPASTPSVVKPAVQQSDRLIVANHGATKESAQAAAGGATAAVAISLRERELAAAIDRSIIAEMELMARIRELEESRIRIEARIQALGAAPATAAPSAGAASSASPPPQIVAGPTVTSDSDADADPDVNDRYLLIVLVLGVLLLALLLRRRSRQEPTPGSIRPLAPARVMDAPGGRADIAPGVPSQNGLSLPVTMNSAVAAGTVDWKLPDVDASASGTVDDAAVEQADEHQSAVELADIMMSFGRLHGAADTLSEFIRGNPKQAVTPWLKLLEVYRTAGLRAEFNAMAKEFNKTFNVITVTWENYDDLRKNSVSVEHVPHIIEHIEHSWRTRDCQVYLQRLLRDNRAGTREGFPFSVIDDILMLSAVLEQELGPALPPAGSSRVRTH